VKRSTNEEGMEGDQPRSLTFSAECQAERTPRSWHFLSQPCLFSSIKEIAIGCASGMYKKLPSAYVTV
jgi:hypothetical protein